MVQIKLWTDKKALVVTPVKTQSESSKQLHSLALPIRAQRFSFCLQQLPFSLSQSNYFSFFFFFLMDFINHICQPYKQHLLTLEVKHLKGCIYFSIGEANTN